MKQLIKAVPLVLLLTFVGCESEETLPVVNSDPFSEAELTTLIDQMVDASKSTDAAFTRHAMDRASSSVAPVLDPINGLAVVGNSKLLRVPQGVAMALKSKLIPKHTYTIWWVIWNFPENCATPYACEEIDFENAVAVGVDVLYAAGNVAPRNGMTPFKGKLREGDVSGSINDLLGLEPIGILDSNKAEVHLVVRSHGPAIPGQVKDQISSFAGGCTVFLPGFVEIPDEVGECADIYFAIHAAP